MPKFVIISRPLRALDWTIEAPYKDYPQLTVYHLDSEKDQHSFVNVGFSGFVGLITGVNNKRIGISEIGPWWVDKSYFPSESHDGLPFVWMLRDALQFYDKGKDVETYFKETKRTCNLLLGIGDGKPESQYSVRGNFKQKLNFRFFYSILFFQRTVYFRGISSDAGRIEFYDDTNMEPNVLTLQNGTVDESFDLKHDRIENVVYYSMDWFCPTFNGQLRDRLRENWGKINAKNLISDVIPSTNTGNLHITVYDYSDDSMYLAFARRSDVEEGSLYGRNLKTGLKLKIYKTQHYVLLKKNFNLS